MQYINVPLQVKRAKSILVNLALRKHYRLQYSAQAIRHVASQIDELYRAKLDADIETGIQGGENAVLLDILTGKADFSDPVYAQ